MITALSNINTNTPLLIEQVKKSKKNEPRILPLVIMIDKEAFGQWDERNHVLKNFWRSSNNKIVVARKPDTKSIIGYACYVEMNNGCYLMRIAVRAKCQRQGVGRQLINYLLIKYPKYLSLDVNDDNQKAISFYERVGLKMCETYKILDKCGFIKFETPYEGFRLKGMNEVENQNTIITVEALKKFDAENKMSEKISAIISELDTQGSEIENSVIGNMSEHSLL